MDLVSQVPAGNFCGPIGPQGSRRRLNAVVAPRRGRLGVRIPPRKSHRVNALLWLHTREKPCVVRGHHT